MPCYFKHLTHQTKSLVFCFRHLSKIRAHRIYLYKNTLTNMSIVTNIPLTQTLLGWECTALFLYFGRLVQKKNNGCVLKESVSNNKLIVNLRYNYWPVFSWQTALSWLMCNLYISRIKTIGAKGAINSLSRVIHNL